MQLCRNGAVIREAVGGEDGGVVMRGRALVGKVLYKYAFVRGVASTWEDEVYHKFTLVWSVVATSVANCVFLEPALSAKVSCKFILIGEKPVKYVYL